MVAEQRGFTILEVLVGITLFAFGMIALFRLQIAVIQNNSSNSETSQVMALVQSKMEDLMALDYNNAELVDSNGNEEGGLGDVLSPDFSQTSGSYTLSWNVAVDYPIANTKSIRLIASWTDRRDVDHQIVVNCTKTNN
jgi:type IV pilus assembly protein PilV